MAKLFEQQNPYRGLGFARNPFRFEVDYESFLDVALQREANRLFLAVSGADGSSARRPLVVELGDVPFERQVAFLSYAFRSFLNAPAGDWYVFDMPAHMLRARGVRSGSEAVRARFFEPIAPRLFYSYAYEKLREVEEAGALAERLPSFDDPRAWLREVERTRGQALADTLFYRGEPVSESASDPEDEGRLARRDDLSRLLLELIEADDVGESARGALRTFVQAGPEVAIGNFLPHNYRDDLSGALALVGHAYSGAVCLVYGLHDVPALAEDDLAEVEAVVSELEVLMKRQARVLYFTPTPYDELHAVFFEGKPSFVADLAPAFLDTERPGRQDFVSACLYLVGAFPAQESSFLKDVEEAAARAFDDAEGSVAEALRLVASAFDRYAAGTAASLAEAVAQ